MKHNIKQLRDRVERLTGPDRETSVAVLMTLFPDYERDCAEETASIPHEDPLRSIDAVEALRQQLLPGSWHRSQVLSDCCTGQIATSDGWMPAATAPTEPLARLLALIEALIAVRHHADNLE